MYLLAKSSNKCKEIKEAFEICIAVESGKFTFVGGLVAWLVSMTYSWFTGCVDTLHCIFYVTDKRVQFN